MSDSEPIPVETTAADVEASANDKRPKMPEPLPVRLIAVADVCLPAQTGHEAEMDYLYITLLGFQREPSPGLIYLSDTFRLCFNLVEGLISRDTYRPAQIEILSLGELEHRLVEAEIEYTRQRGLTPGSESLVFLDPSGNCLEVTQRRDLR